MRFVEIDGEVLKEEEISTYTQVALVRTHHCFAKKLIATTTPNTVAVNTPLAIQVQLQDWQGNPLQETLSVTVKVDGPGEADQQLELLLANGKGEFSFIAEIAGTFVIRVSAPRVDMGQIEVVVE